MTRTRLVIVAVAFALALSACGGPPPPPTSPGGLGLVVGARANAAAPVLGPAVRDLARAVVTSGGRAAVVVGDGRPAVVESGEFTLGCQNEAACEVEVTAQVDGLAGAVGAVRAAAPESDLLGAMALAADAVQGLPGPRSLVVLDSGLSTAGALRFQEPGVLDADPAELAEFLATRGELPDLTGLTVIFRGLGDVAAPQEPLAVPQRANLRAIWSGLATRAGAVSVQVDTEPVADVPQAGLPPVAVVPVARPAELGCFGTLRQADLGFVADAATFVDEAAARATLTPMAVCLRDLGRSAVVTGTTASAGSEEGRRELSEQRATAVAALLVELGVPADRITPRGLGYQVPPCVPDRGPDGALLPDAAARNRQVIVEPSAS